MNFLKSLFVAMALMSALGSGTAEATAGRCYCQPQGNYYVLWYVDRDGKRHVIYTYDQYSECAQGLANTFLCN